MEDLLFMVFTRKGGRAMKFLMSDFPLLVCVKLGTSEVEVIFFRVVQIGSFRSE